MSGNMKKWTDPPSSRSSASSGVCSGSSRWVPQVVVHKMGITLALSTLPCVVTSDELLMCH